MCFCTKFSCLCNQSHRNSAYMLLEHVPLICITSMVSAIRLVKVQLKNVKGISQCKNFLTTFAGFHRHHCMITECHHSTCLVHCICRGWQPRSANLNPVSFCLLGRMKPSVYEEELKTQ
jgi:hypothetical protein